jgi:hypothetical protein
MDTLRRVFGPWRRWSGLLLAALAVAVAMPAAAREDPPGRVGRLVDLQGRVSWFDAEQGRWAEPQRNRPLAEGDRLSTDSGGRVELRIGSTTLRLGGGSELEVLRLDDGVMQFQLHAGKLALRVRSREVAEEIEVLTPEARMRPLRSGHYRIDRIDDSTFAGAWRGEIRIEGPDPLAVAAGQRIEIWRERGGTVARRDWSVLPDDDFGQWVQQADQRDERRSASNRYVSPEMTGAEELDRNGRWDRHPEFGAIWVPTVVIADWAPYRFGRWAWVRPWGWTWIDDAPWGFAPFHYGRWVWWRDRWNWAPGAYVARPVYSPALVAWVGGPNFSISIGIGGGPAVGWVALAPRDPYVPWYRHTPGYLDRVSPPTPQPRPPGYRPPPQVPTGPIMYGNQGVPNAVTVVPRDVLVQQQPVARAVVPVPDAARVPVPVGRPPLGPVVVAPAAPSAAAVPAMPSVQMVPGGAVPLPPARPAPATVATQPSVPAAPVAPLAPAVPAAPVAPLAPAAPPAPVVPLPSAVPAAPPRAAAPAASPTAPAAPVVTLPATAPQSAPQPAPQPAPTSAPTSAPTPPPAPAPVAPPARVYRSDDGRLVPVRPPAAAPAGTGAAPVPPSQTVRTDPAPPVPPAPPVLVAPQRAGEPAERREPKDPRDGADERRRIPEGRQGQRERDASR